MKTILKAAAAASALLGAGAARAQHDMQGMQMPMTRPSPAPAPTTPPPQSTTSAPQATAAHAGHGQPPGAMTSMPGMAPEQPMAMTGALGGYGMSREASGTAWQPDATPHGGVERMAGDWMLMGHALLNGVYDWQARPRGGDQAFVSGMVMGMARRDLGRGTLQLRAMLSPDPLMGARGYPLLLASGETADGVTPLVDRQHPHDFFMEMSASYSMRLSDRASLFLYAGLPGEPAFGPPAFMHRLSIMDSPEAPISHHWLDSTHISFGVVTSGLVLGRVKLEASRFNGREPDQHRWNIETGPLDSTALRLSWNPTPNLALQASWSHLVSPEQLEPGVNSSRWSASAIYTRPLGRAGWWSTTFAWGRRSREGRWFDAGAFESAAGLGLWTLFGRAEFTENDELVGGGHGPGYTVGKLSLGAIRDFGIAPHIRFGLGGLYAFDFVPEALRAAYGGNPRGAMAFIRLKVD